MEENHITNLQSNINQNSMMHSTSNPAEIDINLINIQAVESSNLNNTIDSHYNSIENLNKNSNLNYLQESQIEKIRKASCDINLFESEQNNNKESHNIQNGEDRNISGKSFEPSRDGRIILENNKEYQRSSCERIKKSIITSKFKYIGETLDDKRDGFGICEYKKGQVYIGMFKNDMREGIGKIIHSNGDQENAEFSNDKMKGFYESLKTSENVKIQSFIKEKKFTEFFIFEKDNFKYEGEPQVDENSKISFGKLTVRKENSKKIFIGNIREYHVQSGLGLIYKDNCLFYGEVKNKIMVNYIETYSNDGGCFLGFLKDSKKNGIGISFLKDGRVFIGEFDDDQKKGPIFIFTLSKPSIKMELYLMGFKTKTVEKMDTIKKYLHLNYPEFCKILKIDIEKFINKLSPEINQEISNSLKFIEAFKNE